MSAAVESDDWVQPVEKTDEPADATKDSWEANTSSSLKNDDRRKSNSHKKRGGNSSSTQEQGWGAAPTNKDTGGWDDSSNYETDYNKVENWGITPDNNGDTNTNNNNWDDVPTDINPAANENTSGWGTEEGTGWDNPPDNSEGKNEKNTGDDNWGTTTTENNETWNHIEESDETIKNTTEWVNNLNNQQRRDDNRPRDRGERGSRVGRRGRGPRGGRGRGKPSPRDNNYRRDHGGDNDYRGHGHRSSYSRGGGRNQNNEGTLFILNHN